jgi:hypothetical protein
MVLIAQWMHGDTNSRIQSYLIRVATTLHCCVSHAVSLTCYIVACSQRRWQSWMSPRNFTKSYLRKTLTWRPLCRSTRRSVLPITSSRCSVSPARHRFSDIQSRVGQMIMAICIHVRSCSTPSLFMPAFALFMSTAYCGLVKHQTEVQSLDYLVICVYSIVIFRVNKVRFA